MSAAVLLVAALALSARADVTNSVSFTFSNGLPAGTAVFGSALVTNDNNGGPLGEYLALTRTLPCFGAPENDVGSFVVEDISQGQRVVAFDVAFRKTAIEECNQNFFDPWGSSFCWGTSITNGPFGALGSGTNLIVSFNQDDNGASGFIDVYWQGQLIRHAEGFDARGVIPGPTHITLTEGGLLTVSSGGDFFSPYVFSVTLTNFDGLVGARFGWGASNTRTPWQHRLDNVSITNRWLNGEIAGRVTRAGRPEAGVTMTLLSNSVEVATLTTASDGRFNYTNLNGLAETTYSIQPSKSGITFNQDERTFSGRGTNADFQVVVYAGRVYVDGNPSIGMPGVNVSVISATNSSLVMTQVTGLDGRFAFVGLPRGQYETLAQRAGLEIRNPFNFVGPLSMTLGNDSPDTTNASWRVMSSFIAGYVRSNGVALAGVTVTGDGTNVTDATGLYVLTGPFNSPVTVTPTLGTTLFSPAFAQVNIGFPNFAFRDFDVAYKLAGRVVNAPANFASYGVLARLSAPDGRTFSNSFQADGTFSITLPGSVPGVSVQLEMPALPNGAQISPSRFLVSGGQTGLEAFYFGPPENISFQTLSRSRNNFDYFSRIPNAPIALHAVVPPLTTVFELDTTRPGEQSVFNRNAWDADKRHTNASLDAVAFTNRAQFASLYSPAGTDVFGLEVTNWPVSLTHGAGANYTFYLTADDSAALFLDGNLLMANERPRGPRISYNFNNGLPANAVLFGSAYVSNGVLELNPNLGGQSGAFLSDIIAPGEAVNGFDVRFRARLDYSVSGVPADGFSFNWATNLPNGAYGEGGAGNGLRISFDSYNNGAGDFGVSVLWNDTLVTNVPVTFLATNQNTFADVAIRLYPDGQLDVSYKGVGILGGVQLPGFYPLTNARFGFGARTGGAWSTHGIYDFDAQLYVTPPTPTLAALAYDFNSGLPTGTAIIGDAFVSGGVLELNPSSGGSGAFLSEPVATSAPVSGFTATFRARVDYTGSPVPADGFSFNWAYDLPNSSYGEQGAGSGLRVTFDTYQNDANDDYGISAWWNGTLVTNVPVSFIATNADVFADVAIALHSGGTLDVSYRGAVVFAGVQIPNFQPIANSRFGLGARTGGFRETHGIDDLIIQPLAEPVHLASTKSATISLPGAGVQPHQLTLKYLNAGGEAALKVEYALNDAGGSNFSARAIFTGGANAYDVPSSEQVLANSPGSQSRFSVPAVLNLGTGTDGHFNGDTSFAPPSGFSYWVYEIVGTIEIPTAGDWTFGVRSDDGFGCAIGTNYFAYSGMRSAADSYATFNLAAGSYPVRLVYFNGAGMGELEFFAAPGTFTSFNSAFRLVGDTANGGLATTRPPSTLARTTVPGPAHGTFVRLPNVYTNLWLLTINRSCDFNQDVNFNQRHLGEVTFVPTMEANVFAPSATVVAPGGSADFIIQGGYTARVTDPDGEPLAGVTINVRQTGQDSCNNHGLIVATAVTDANGYISIDPVIVLSAPLMFVPSGGTQSFDPPYVVTGPRHDIVFRTRASRPRFGPIATQVMDEDTVRVMPFTVSDLYTPADLITLRVSSDNQAIIADSGLTLGGSGTNRTLTIRPNFNANSLSPTRITLTANNRGSGGAAFFTRTMQLGFPVQSAFIANFYLENTPYYPTVISTVPLLNFANEGSFPGYFAGATEFPGLTGPTNYFIVEAVGTVHIPTSGEWTFGVRSDDGFICTIGGTSFTFDGLRGANDSFATYNLAAGAYPVRIVYFENDGGAGLQFFAASGNHATFNNTFRLVGDTTNGGLAAGGTDRAITFDVIVQPVNDPPTAGAYTGMRFQNNRLNSPGTGGPMLNGELTIEFWQKVTNAPPHETTGIYPGQGNKFFRTYVPWVDGVVYFDYGDWTGPGRLGYVPPENIIGTWQHWAFVATKSANGGAGAMRIYRNGVLEAERNSVDGFSPANVDLFIGGLSYQGELAEYRVWNVARTERQIQLTRDTPLRGDEANLLVYYRFIEGAGPTVNDSATLVGGANNATAIDTPPPVWLRDSPALETALEFEGNYVDTPNFGQIAPTEEITVEFWQKADEGGGTTFMVGQGQDSRINGYAPYFDGVVYFDFGVWFGGGRLQYTPPENILGTWQHWAFVASKSANGGAGLMRIYRNGILEAQKNTSLAFSPTNSSLFIGAGDAFLNGQVAEFRIWNVARTEGQIRNTKDVALAGTEPGLVLYYRFRETSGATVLDHAPASGNNAGTLINNPTRIASGGMDKGYVRELPADEDAVTALFLPSFDFDSPVLNYTIVTLPAHGSLTQTNGYGGAVWNYLPTTNYYGRDRFTYRVTDAGGLSATATILLNISNVNDVPIISTIPNQTITESQVSPAIPFIVQDGDGFPELLEITVQSSDEVLVRPANVLFQTNSPISRFLTVLPEPNQIGTLTITLTVSDGIDQVTTSFDLRIEPRPAFSIVEIGAPASRPITFGTAINDRGAVAAYGAVNNLGQQPRAFVNQGLDNGLYVTELGTLGGPTATALGINGGNEVVGGSLVTGGGSTHAFKSDGVTMVDLGTLTGGTFSLATAINDAGLVAGYATITGVKNRAFLWQPGGSMQNLGTLAAPFHDSSQAFAINSENDVVGVSFAANGQSRAFLRHGILQTTHDLGTLGGNSSVARGVNPFRHVVGSSEIAGGGTRAFVWRDGVMTSLGTLPGGGNSEARAINEFGQIVGSAFNSNGTRRATLFTQGQMFDLNDVVPEEQQLAGWILSEANAINSRGEIVGTGTKNGQTRAFLIVPAAVIGRQVARPQGTVARRPEIELLDSKPGDSAENSFFWSDAPGEKKLYATRPVTARIKWGVSDSLLDTNRVPVVSISVWPRSPQIHVSEAPVEIEPAVGGFRHKYIETRYTTSSDAMVDPNTKVFTATNSGYTVLMYLRNNGASPDPQTQPPYFEVARTLPVYDYRHFLDEQPAIIGASLTSPFQRDYPGRNGWVWFPHCFIDSVGEEAAYDRPTRTGPILPVNRLTGRESLANPLVVVWYSTNRIGVSWGQKAVRYQPDWSTNAPRIVIASGQGGGFLPPNIFQDIRLYNQPNAALPGFNPNEEHGLILPGPSGETVYALRNDLNAVANYSEPYALLKYRDATTPGREWRILPHLVVITNETHRFTFTGDVGKEIQPPFPLSVFNLCAASEVVSGPGWRDKDNKLFAIAAGAGLNDPVNIVARYQYPMQPGFQYDINRDGMNDVAIGTCVPWLDRRPGGTPGVSIDVTYSIYWPTNAPTLQIGETLLRARRGLPDVNNFFSAEIVFDSTNPDGTNYAGAGTRLFDPLSARTIRFSSLSNLSVPGVSYEMPSALRRTTQSGLTTFDDLSPDLKGRLSYDPVNRALTFAGTLDEGVVGAPLLLLNVISPLERDKIKALFAGTGDSKTNWDRVVDALYWHTRNPRGVDLAPRDGRPDEAFRVGLAYQYTIVSNGIREVVFTRPTPGPNVQIIATNIGAESVRGGTKALIAAGYENFTGPRFITIVENNDRFAEGPVALHVIRVDGGPYLGDLKFLTAENVFSEKLSIRHSSDFGGEPERLGFEWYYKPDSAAFDPTDLPRVDANGNVTDPRGWLFYTPGAGDGINTVTLGEGGESSLLVLGDTWFVGRYRGYNINGQTPWTAWIGDPSGTAQQPRAALAEGWIKRVVRGVNPFDQRFSDFHQNEVNTFASMLIQAGKRYEGDIAFNGDALGNVGLIEAYTTMLNRGKKLSIEGIPAVNFDPANNALLFASSRISDLYMLLGNEAFADATDPTIGFGIGSGEYGSAATSIHAFMNQVANLLEEELSLLRGRDNSSAGVGASPVYNRLFWNFTLGEGELAYQQSFNIGDFDLDGFISERDARIQYPQGHGDAWGHYLTASKLYYDLMRHQNFTWVPRAESVNLLGTAIAVDYFDERKFARIAAHKAKTAGEIVSVTYRQKFVDDTSGQWQGYNDTDPDRAWGVTEWARRAGQAAMFDWVAANALLFAQDPNPNHTGVQKIDRSTVLELREIPVHLSEIQKHLDTADVGLNPVGVAKGSVPFDLDPSALTSPNPSLRKSHFEQIADRAIKAMNNSVKIWDEANQFTALLRRNQDDTDKFVPGVVDEETDYKNRLIEIFGYPYAGDIGPGKTYPSGYAGPDTYHWMYVDTTAITGETAPVSTNFSGFFRPTPNGLNIFTHFPASEQAFRRNYDTNTLESDILQVSYPVTQSAASYTFVAPASWGQRRAPGKLQEAISDVIQQETRLKQALQNYDGLIRNIEDQLQLLAAQKQMDASAIRVLNGQRQTLQGMNAAIGTLKGIQITTRRVAGVVRDIADLVGDSIPKVVGLAFDVGSIPKGAIKGSAFGGVTALEVTADALEIAENSIDLAKDDVERRTEIQLEVISRDFEVLQRVKEIQSMMRDEAVNRLEVFNQREMLNQSVGKLRNAIADGERLMDQLAVYRQRTSASISEQRYEDMTFRFFRNEALQKYRASFDLAARYVFLAANAYDYEVNFLGSDTRAGREFLTDIVRQRTLGQIIDGQPVIGQGGLAEPLARMLANWNVLKSRYGINNPLVTDSRFSLRRELLRVNGATASDNTWREVLQQSRVANLWDMPEFRRFCRPFAPESAGPQPGLVVRFPTTVTFGLNFFGWPLSGGDSQYDPTRFATKINRVGVWLTGSDGTQIAATPNVYLVPAGMDVLRSPSGNSLATREWRIIDQVIPEPFPIGQNALNDPNWIPQFDSVGGTFAEIRRFSSFPAYHDQGFYAENQTTIDSRLIGRSVWNTDWLLIIPGGTLLNDPNEGLDTFINTVDDIKIYFQTYSYSGN